MQRLGIRIVEGENPMVMPEEKFKGCLPKNNLKW